METCGYCDGRGWIFGNTHDCEGRQVHDSPPQVACEYCNGAGECDDGNKLLPATPPQKEESSGNPVWA